ncbi:uncharacterized protein LOC131046282 [Cryptomeria japonica]|uniref:uncharacterized protein LOC131046282 n=1 Tax=Cryptomeria japonica TaxID=3369 RepID=UPI0027DA455A|nr:uncharacterized protein LOC131046282 [Cryptomeria japonica]
MGNSCGCCLSTSPATPHPHIPPPHPPPHPPPSPPPPPSLESVIHSISQSIGNENPTQKIGLLIQFIDDMLLKIKAPSQHGASTSSSGIQLDSVAWGTKAASEIIDTISREAKELEKSEVAKELGNVALKAVKLVGESHWIFLGLSMAAYALERCVTVRSNVSEVNELLEKIVDLAKDVKKLGETTPRDISERLCSAVHIIVEGTILCCEYTDQGKLQRYWLAAAMQTQLEKTGKSIQDITSSLTHSTVADIKKQLPWRIEQSPQNLLDFKPEGIEEKVAKVREIVDLEGSEATVAVILWGFGGVGKSILALSCIQELNCISKGYKFCRVIIDEKTPDRTSHIKQLQKDIINDFGGGKLDLRNTEEGRHQVFKVVMNKRCLLFIDNVVDSWYIKELLPSDFPQSEENIVSVQVAKEARLRIVITSRQNNIKQLLNIKKFNEYHVDPLSYPAAKIILRKTILGGQGESHLKGDFDEEGCINAIAEACKGVPLLLSVFGNCLRAETERDQTFYKEALKALTEADFDRFADEENLSEKLMFVYDKMRDPEAKEAFLDICTQFHGWRWIHVAEIVDSNNLESLHKRGLVKRDESGKVIVHDILRLMGSKAAKETRITNHREFLAVVEEEYKLKNIKGVALTDNTSLATIESAHLNAMRHSLRVLILGDWVVINGLCHGAFTNLRYLSVGDVTAFPFTGVFKMEKLKRFYNKSKPGMDLPEVSLQFKAVAI